ncbi:hypothetical protein JF729_27355 [Mycobacterium intracellulare]|nr:hypothetical protein [Mycobacterium intracellulare]MCA2251504.1 hypothetical protein [Mycobacterium intracellulare]
MSVVDALRVAGAVWVPFCDLLDEVDALAQRNGICYLEHRRRVPMSS